MSASEDWTDAEIREFIGRCVECGLVAYGADGHLNVTPEGRRFFNMPDDSPSLIQLGLEALLDEIVTEDMEKRASRPMAGGRQ